MNLVLVRAVELGFPLAQTVDGPRASPRVLDHQEKSRGAEASDPMPAGLGFLVQHLHGIFDLKIDLRFALALGHVRPFKKSAIS
ncbi:MAG: hypothetical protein IH986_10485 [Planctomycetes bacterium]|nr:hypothetical protein [Planctomycetota bacterium]